MPARLFLCTKRLPGCEPACVVYEAFAVGETRDGREAGARDALARLTDDEAVQLAAAKVLYELAKAPTDGRDWSDLPATLVVRFIQEAERVVATVREALTGVLVFDGILPASAIRVREIPSEGGGS